jgi:hypothetical protein
MKLVRFPTMVAAVIIALLAAAAAAPAQEQGEMPEMTPEMQAEMAAWMKLAQPGAHHEHLAPFVGTWKGKVTMWMGPGQAPMVEESMAEATWLLGGRFLQWKNTGNFGGMPFEGMAIEGYNNGEERYESVWLDNFGTLLLVFEGSCSDDGKHRKMASKFADVVAGGVVDYRTEYQWIDSDHFTYSAFMNKGDGEFQNLVIEYERQ